MECESVARMYFAVNISCTVACNRGYFSCAYLSLSSSFLSFFIALHETFHALPGRTNVAFPKNAYFLEIKARWRIHVAARFHCMALSSTRSTPARSSSATVERKHFTLKVSPSSMPVVHAILIETFAF